MHEQRVFTTDIHGQLTNRFQEWQGFDITDGTADFNQHHIVTFATGEDTLFDSVSDVWDNLHGCAQIVTATLFAQDI